MTGFVKYVLLGRILQSSYQSMYSLKSIVDIYMYWRRNYVLNSISVKNTSSYHNFQESNEHKFLHLSVSPFCMMLQKETINPGSVSKGGNLTGQVWKTTIKCYYIIYIFLHLLTLFIFFQIEILRFKLKTCYY